MICWPIKVASWMLDDVAFVERYRATDASTTSREQRIMIFVAARRQGYLLTKQEREFLRLVFAVKWALLEKPTCYPEVAQDLETKKFLGQFKTAVDEQRNTK